MVSVETKCKRLIREIKTIVIKRNPALKSRKLLLEEWYRNRWVRENYHAETGQNPGTRSEHLYHWGALLGMIDLMENAGI